MPDNDSAHRHNPWLSIPASDYEGHMNSDNVGQLPVLNRVFESALKDIPSKRIAVLGCGTGNGFEHINSQSVERVLGIDINPEYLSILRGRYASKLPMLELSCSDLSAVSCPDNSFDLIYAALIFEYVDFHIILKDTSNWLEPTGTLVVVLQLPSPESEMISQTAYPSLKSLGSIMRLVNPDAFRKMADQCGLRQSREFEVPLKLSKRFLISYYTKWA